MDDEVVSGDEIGDETQTAQTELGNEDGPYDWFVRCSRLLDDGQSVEAAELFSRLVQVDPTSRSAWEGLARARFDSRDYEKAAEAFEQLVDLAPDEDYAHFGLGLAFWRLRRFAEARDHLGMALVMRPERAEYATALGQVKATLAARRSAGLSPDGQPGESMDGAL